MRKVIKKKKLAHSHMVGHSCHHVDDPPALLYWLLTKSPSLCTKQLKFMDTLVPKTENSGAPSECEWAESWPWRPNPHQITAAMPMAPLHCFTNTLCKDQTVSSLRYPSALAENSGVFSKSEWAASPMAVLLEAPAVTPTSHSHGRINSTWNEEWISQ